VCCLSSWRVGSVGDFSSAEDFCTYFAICLPVIEYAKEGVSVVGGYYRNLLQIIFSYVVKGVGQGLVGSCLVYDGFGYVACKEPIGDVSVCEHFLDVGNCYYANDTLINAK